MTRKWMKRIITALLVFAILLAGVHLILRILSGSNWFHHTVVQQISAATGREVQLGRLSLGLNRLGVEEFALARAEGFEKGTDLHVRKLYLKISWLHLLRGHIKVVAARIDGVALHIVRDKQGKFNWTLKDEAAAVPAAPQESEPFEMPVGLSVLELAFRNMHFTYTDELEQIQVDLRDTDLLVRDFSLDDPFDIRLNTSVLFHTEKGETTLPLGIALQANLADLDLSKASAKLKNLSLRNGSSRVYLVADVTNFADPVFSVRLSGKNLSHEWLKDFTQDLPAFNVPEMELSAKGALAFAAQMWRVDEAALSLPGIKLDANGKGNWGHRTYSFAATLKAALDEAGKQLDLLQAYKLNGTLDLEAHGDQKAFVTQMNIQNGGGHFAQTGAFSHVDASFTGQGNLNGKEGEGALHVAGRLNEEPFQADVVLAQTPARITAGIKASAERLILPPAKPAQQVSAQPSAQASTWALPPLDINADIQIGSLDVPYLSGKDLRFKTDLSGVTPRLNQTHGQFNLSVGNGKITDLYQLTNANPLTKVLFMSLSVVGKVFNSLNVLSVLGGLAGGNGDKNSPGEEVIQMVMGEDGNPVAIKVPAASRKIEGTLPYDKFITRIRFDEGLATVEEGHFVSNMMSFQLSGTTDFNTEKIKMTVHAAPGKHETDGMMPLTLHIGGTVNEPQGNMSMVGSVTSLVTQGVTNNFASRAVKKSIGGFFGLFKKKEKPETLQQPVEQAPAEAAPESTAETTEAVPAE